MKAAAAAAHENKVSEGSSSTLLSWVPMPPQQRQGRTCGRAATLSAHLHPWARAVAAGQCETAPNRLNHLLGDTPPPANATPSLLPPFLPFSAVSQSLSLPLIVLRPCPGMCLPLLTGSSCPALMESTTHSGRTTGRGARAFSYSFTFASGRLEQMRCVTAGGRGGVGCGAVGG